MKIVLSDLSSSAIRSITIDDGVAEVEFQGSLTKYAYGIKRGMAEEEVAQQFLSATSIGAEFNHMVRTTTLIPM